MRYQSCVLPCVQGHGLTPWAPPASICPPSPFDTLLRPSAPQDGAQLSIASPFDFPSIPNSGSTFLSGMSGGAQSSTSLSNRMPPSPFDRPGETVAMLITGTLDALVSCLSSGAPPPKRFLIWQQVLAQREICEGWAPMISCDASSQTAESSHSQQSAWSAGASIGAGRVQQLLQNSQFGGHSLGRPPQQPVDRAARSPFDVALGRSRSLAGAHILISERANCGNASSSAVACPKSQLLAQEAPCCRALSGWRAKDSLVSRRTMSSRLVACG